jgi:tetratricopeptide (TPR) repeat protein
MDEAQRACAAGSCEQSIEWLEQAVLQRPGDFRLHYRLGACYSGCCRHHALVHPEMAVPYLRHALRLLGTDAGEARAAILDQLGNALVERGHNEGADSLRSSIDCHRDAAEAYLSLRMLDDWARLQFNLGNSYCELSEQAGEDHWQAAVSAFRKSLMVRTRQKDPQHFASTLENLGVAYRQLADYGASIRCFRQALWIYTPTTNPEKCAALHNNLGNVFLCIPDASVRNARRALRHFGRARNLQPAVTRARAITEYNCAQAYLRLGEPKAAATCLSRALVAFRSGGDERYQQLSRSLLARLPS